MRFFPSRVESGSLSSPLRPFRLAGRREQESGLLPSVRTVGRRPTRWDFYNPVIFLVLLLVSAVPVLAQEQKAGEIPLKTGLAVSSVGRYGRTALHTDAIESRIVAGTWTPPKAGEKVTLPDGAARTWEAVIAGPDGAFRGPAFRGGYASFLIESATEKPMILEAAGHNLVYVNGVPRTGDPYETGKTRLPVLLKQGTNELLFLSGRGSLRAKLVPPKALVAIDLSDPTLPDILLGEKQPVLAATVLINASPYTAMNLALETAVGKEKPLVTRLPPIPPYATRKVPFLLRPPAKPMPGNVTYRLTLLSKNPRGTQPLDKAEVALRVRQPGEVYRQTFLSKSDGSVQYYAVNPARPLPKATDLPALILTLHGASVEAQGQAEAYNGKTWAHLVAPTNRRPFGFDWEDWGRLDAMEVLELAQSRLKTDPRRTYLTGHSMGGHGTWHIGVTYPDRFAAIGPSAGWVSFFSYAGARREENPDPLLSLFQRAASPSDTLALVRNTLHYGVYILHGGADDNVPATEAQTMATQLAGFHKDYTYFEQPGAGHWWGNSDEPGAACVDWPPMFDMFSRHTLPPEESVREVDFTTANPGVSARSRWLTLAAQTHPLLPSHAHFRYDPGLRRFVGTTANVARLVLSLKHVPPGSPISVEVDKQKLTGIPYPTGLPQVWLERQGETWRVGTEPSADVKGPHRYGPFKDAFRNRMLFVVGTRGSAEENAQLYAKARYDAETFWYRGNGAVDIVADTAFDPNAERDRNVILYGSSDTNAAWNALLTDSPVQVKRGLIRIGEREERGDDLACLFLRPRPGSRAACVGVVAGTGLIGMRLTERLPYFVSGVAFPDCLVLGSETLTNGPGGIRCTGFFGPDWRVETGEFAWRNPRN